MFWVGPDARLWPTRRGRERVTPAMSHAAAGAVKIKCTAAACIPTFAPPANAPPACHAPNPWHPARRDGRLAAAGCGRRADRFQPRHPPDPGRQVFLLPRAGRKKARGRPAARHARGALAALQAKPGETSELLRRIRSTDPDERMPPPKSNRSLSPEQIDLIARWVAGGAAWGDHWAFRPLVAPAVPGRGWPACRCATRLMRSSRPGWPGKA